MIESEETFSMCFNFMDRHWLNESWNTFVQELGPPIKSYSSNFIQLYVFCIHIMFDKSNDPKYLLYPTLGDSSNFQLPHFSYIICVVMKFSFCKIFGFGYLAAFFCSISLHILR